MKLSLRLLGIWLMAAGAMLPARAVAAPDVAFSAVARVSQVDGSRAEVAVRSGSVLRSGDEIQLRLVADRDAYVYVLAHGSSGRLKVLRPFSGDDGDARVRARIEQAWPDRDTFLPLDDQEGQETLFAIASERPLGDLAPLLEQLDGADAEAVGRELEATFPATTTLSFRHVARDALVGLPANVPRRAAEAPATPEREQDAPDMRALMETLPGDPSGGRGESGVLSASGSLIEKLTRGRDLSIQDPVVPAPAPRTAAPELPRVERPSVPADAAPEEKPSLGRRLGRLFRFGRKDPEDEAPAESTPLDKESRAPADLPAVPEAQAFPVPAAAPPAVAPVRPLPLASRDADDDQASEQSLTARAMRDRAETEPAPALAAQVRPATVASRGAGDRAGEPSLTARAMQDRAEAEPVPALAAQVRPSTGVSRDAGDDRAGEPSLTARAMRDRAEAEPASGDAVQVTLAARGAGDDPAGEPTPAASAVPDRAAEAAARGDAARSVVLVVTPRASGAGVVLDRAGRVLTSWHVIAGSTSASVLVPRAGAASLERRHGARVLRIDRFADLALLAIDRPPDLAPAVLAAANSVQVGASVQVLTPDWPDGLGRVAGQVVRAQHRSSWTSAGALHRARLIRAELEADPGMPGAPVFDDADRLIGLAVAGQRKLGAVSVVSSETIHGFLGREAPPPRLARAE